MDVFVHLRKKTAVGGTGRETARESAPATSLWGMLYADTAGVISQALDQLRKNMGVIVVVCSAVGLTVSEAMAGILCLRAKRMPESTTIFSLEAAGQVYNQTNEVVNLGRMSTYPSRSSGADATHVAASGSTSSNCTTDGVLPSS